MIEAILYSISMISNTEYLQAYPEPSSQHPLAMLVDLQPFDVVVCQRVRNDNSDRNKADPELRV